jgi:hypothetical protein
VIGIPVDEVLGLCIVSEYEGLLDGGAVSLLPAGTKLDLAGVEDSALSELSEIVCQHFIKLIIT